MFLFRWLDRPPEDFVEESTVSQATTDLPAADTNQRLRWNLNSLHTALNAERQQRELTWRELADELGCTPARLTNLKTAKLADLALVVGVAQWLAAPTARFIYAADS